MRLRRWTEHTPVLEKVRALRWWHRALQRGESLYQKRVTPVDEVDRVFISGVNNRKIGAVVQKGRLKGFPVFTLTLEERKTCPRDCTLWATCYGNSMNWPKRLVHGPDLEKRIQQELGELSERYPEGFLIRLHILGDFYSAAYVKKWDTWLKRFPALHVYGYTQWGTRTEIGREIARVRKANWERFAVRTSNAGLKRYGAETLRYYPDTRSQTGPIVCPVETDRCSSCVECGLCWQSERSIAFILH